MAEFDPIRSIQQELEGLAAVRLSMKRREAVAEEAMGKAEQELNDLRKLSGFLSLEIERKRKVLQDLVDKQESKDESHVD